MDSTHSDLVTVCAWLTLPLDLGDLQAAADLFSTS
jgi:hypothetical protein